MEIITPAYYHRFRCLASACPDSCCKEWAVQIDENSARLYRQLSGELGDRLRAAMQEEDGDTILALTPDKRCPMWREDGLCSIQFQLGEEGLCDTCRQFPRLRHDYGDFLELGLELSCPEAARLILSSTCHETVATQALGGDMPDYDTDAMRILRGSREEVLAYLNDTSHTVGQALAVILLYGYSVQHALDGGEPTGLAADRTLQEVYRLAAPGSIDDILDFYRNLEILTPVWKRRLDAPCGSPWSEELRAMARYFVSRYWLQAISDYDLIGRVKLIIVSCLVVKALGGDVFATAQLYSKEIENDADNIDAILDGAYTSFALADIRLLGLLLAE